MSWWDLLAGQSTGLTVGGVLGVLATGTTIAAAVANMRRQKRAGELADKAALQEERRAERETFDVRAKALEAAVQAHEKNVSAQQQRAQLFEEKTQELQEHLNAVLDSHSTLHEEYEDLKNKLQDKTQTDIEMMDMIVVLLLSSAVIQHEAVELDKKFERQWSSLEEKLRAEIAEFFGVDLKREGQFPGDEPWPANYMSARVALLQLRETVLAGRMQALALRSNISLIAKVWDLKRDDKTLTGTPLLEAIEHVIEEHKADIAELVGKDDEDTAEVPSADVQD